MATYVTKIRYQQCVVQLLYIILSENLYFMTKETSFKLDNLNTIFDT